MTDNPSRRRGRKDEGQLSVWGPEPEATPTVPATPRRVPGSRRQFAHINPAMADWARALDGHPGDEPADDRRAGRGDRRLRGGPPKARRRPPLHPAPPDGPSGSVRSSRTRSPRRSATSAGSRAPRSSPGTPGCAHSSVSRATATSGGRSPRTVRSTSAGRSSRLPPTLPGMPTIATATSGPSGAWAVSVARRSPGSTSLASSPKPSGTSSPRMNRLPRQAPRCFWSLDDPLWNWAAGAASYVTLSFSQKAIER